MTDELANALAIARLGRTAEAVAACEHAAREGARLYDCFATAGHVRRLAGDLDEAIDEYIKALHAPGSAMEVAAMQYAIGEVYELRGLREQALYYFQLLARSGVPYPHVAGDAATRVANLSNPPDEPA